MVALETSQVSGGDNLLKSYWFYAYEGEKRGRTRNDSVNSAENHKEEPLGWCYRSQHEQSDVENGASMAGTGDQTRRAERGLLGLWPAAGRRSRRRPAVRRSATGWLPGRFAAHRAHRPGRCARGRAFLCAALVAGGSVADLGALAYACACRRACPMATPARRRRRHIASLGGHRRHAAKVST